MRGQLFILTAFVMCLAIISLTNSLRWNSLPMETSFGKMSPAAAMTNNVKTEIVQIMRMAPDNATMMDDFKDAASDWAAGKNFNLVIENSSAAVVGCDVNITALPANAEDFTVNLTSYEADESLGLTYRVCW
jgi:hypothetical protein